MIGVSVTIADLNFRSGEITTLINDNFNKGLEIKQYLDGVGKAGLVALGYTDAEADIMISAFNDLETAKAQFDSSPFIKQIYGLGFK